MLWGGVLPFCEFGCCYHPRGCCRGAPHRAPRCCCPAVLLPRGGLFPATLLSRTVSATTVRASRLPLCSPSRDVTASDVELLPRLWPSSLPAASNCLVSSVSGPSGIAPRCRAAHTRTGRLRIAEQGSEAARGERKEFGSGLRMASVATTPLFMAPSFTAT